MNDRITAERSFGNRFFVAAVSLVLVTVLYGLVADRLEAPVAQAERAHVAVRLAELRSAVLLMQATMVAANDWSSASQYEGSNPMHWLDLEPGQGQYQGEMSLEEARNAKGKWVFDPSRKVIAYQPQSNDWWPQQQAPALPWLQFRVVGLRSEDSPQEIKALTLVSVTGADKQEGGTLAIEPSK